MSPMTHIALAQASSDPPPHTDTRQNVKLIYFLIIFILVWQSIIFNCKHYIYSDISQIAAVY